jgi:hypothetical protein
MKQAKPMTFACAECGAPAVVNSKTVERSCSHSSAGIKAMMSATATGEAKVAS